MIPPARLEYSGDECALGRVAVEKALQRVPGVLNTRVDLKAKRAVARYDPEKTAPDRLAAAVTGAGFPATVLPK